jgi:hypothetical protein
MQKMEEAKAEAQRIAEIESAVSALKTNLMFSAANYVLFGLNFVLSANIVGLVTSAAKLVAAILTTVLNFVKLKQLALETWQGIFKPQF